MLQNIRKLTFEKSCFMLTSKRKKLYVTEKSVALKAILHHSNIVYLKQIYVRE